MKNTDRSQQRKRRNTTFIEVVKYAGDVYLTNLLKQPESSIRKKSLRANLGKEFKKIKELVKSQILRHYECKLKTKLHIDFSKEDTDMA